MQLVEQQRKLKPKPRNRKQKPNPNPNSNPIPNPKPKSEIWIEVAAKNANRCLDKNSSVTHISTRSVCVRECVCGHSRLHWSIFKLCWQAFVYSNSPFRGTKLHVCTTYLPPSLASIGCPSATYHPYLSNSIGSFILDVHILTDILIPNYIEVQPIEEDMADSAGAISIAGRLIQRRRLITHSIPFRGPGLGQGINF